MKKGLKAVLMILGVLVLALIGFIVYRLLSPAETGDFFTIEECEEALVGEWIDPRGKEEPYVFRADHTGNVLGKEITWEVVYRLNDERGMSYAVFSVDYYFTESDSEEPDGELDFHYYDEWDLTLSSCDVSEREDTIHWYRCKVGTVDIIEITAENWEQYFEIAGESKWSTVDGNWYGYTNYVYLKPEYAENFIDLGHYGKENVVIYKCSALCSVVPYCGEVDNEAKTCTALFENVDEETEYKQYNLEYAITDNEIALSTNQREDGAIKLLDLETDSDYNAADEKEGNTINVTFDVLEDIEIIEASGVIVLVKE